MFSWRWNAGSDEDGNWGLKAIRVPAVWNIIDRHRRLHPDEKRPKIGIIDSGFDQTPMVPSASILHVKPLTYPTAQCGTHH